ncbi:hypothetical protein [Nitrobacter winogradskyi]|uniref:hypothetical protein n=1 Tax=Nitrobacter winogradskyi TaxID=913 RepID=UPI0016500C21|nr:hypothetical protein [Nitrobacter winogradskyi]
MKVIAQARDVVAMRVAALVVPFKPTSQVFGHVRRVIVIVVRLTADVDVDEDALTIVEAHQDHVSVGDREESEGGGHWSFPYWICSMGMPRPKK